MFCPANALEPAPLTWLVSDSQLGRAKLGAILMQRVDRESQDPSGKKRSLDRVGQFSIRDQVFEVPCHEAPMAVQVELNAALGRQDSAAALGGSGEDPAVGALLK